MKKPTSWPLEVLLGSCLVLIHCSFLVGDYSVTEQGLDGGEEAIQGEEQAAAEEKDGGTTDFLPDNGPWESELSLAEEPTPEDAGLGDLAETGPDVGTTVESEPIEAKAIFRSVGPEQTAALSCGDDLVIDGDAASFTIDLPAFAGVGDMIVYGPYEPMVDCDIQSDPSGIAMVVGRENNSLYRVLAPDGNELGAATDRYCYCIYRAYTSLADAMFLNPNPGISPYVNDFDGLILGDNGSIDLASMQATWNIACYGNADGNGLQIPDHGIEITAVRWKTGPKNYLRIFAPNELSEVGKSQRHQGVWDDGLYRLKNFWVDSPEAHGQAIHIHGHLMTFFVKIEGLQLDVISSGMLNNYIYGVLVSDLADGSRVEISNCIIRGDGVSLETRPLYRGIQANDDNGNARVLVSNNVIYGFDGCGGGCEAIGCDNFLGKLEAVNNTIAYCYGGMDADTGNILAVNNLFYNCIHPMTDSYAGGTDYNATDSPSLGSDVPGVHNRISQKFEFVNENTSPYDFHLGATDSGALNRGNYDPNTFWFTIDIDGQTRSDGQWDIGADEVVPEGSLLPR